MIWEILCHFIFPNIPPTEMAKFIYCPCTMLMTFIHYWSLMSRTSYRDIAGLVFLGISMIFLLVALQFDSIYQMVGCPEYRIGVVCLGTASFFFFLYLYLYLLSHLSDF